MKKYLKEIVILIIQLLAFYIMPLFAGPIDAMGMVLLLILLTFALSVVLGSISKQKIKYLYPVATALLFIPSVFIYYNETAMVQALWYLVVSVVGMGIGSLIRWVITKIK